MLSSTAMSKQSDGVSPLLLLPLVRFWHNPLVFFLCTFTFHRPGPPRARFNPGGQHGGEEALCARRSLLHLDGWSISRLYGHVVNCLLPWLSSVYFLWIWVTNALYGAQRYVRPWYGGRDEPHGEGLPGWLHERHLLHPSLPGDTSLNSHIHPVSKHLSQPLDVLKTRLQSSAIRSSMRYEASAVMTADGLQGLWRGVLPSLYRSRTIASVQVITPLLAGPYLGSASTSPQCTGCATTFSTGNPTPANHCWSELLPGLLLDLSWSPSPWSRPGCPWKIFELSLSQLSGWSLVPSNTDQSSQHWTQSSVPRAFEDSPEVLVLLWQGMFPSPGSLKISCWYLNPPSPSLYLAFYDLLKKEVTSNTRIASISPEAAHMAAGLGAGLLASLVTQVRSSRSWCQCCSNWNLLSLPMWWRPRCSSANSGKYPQPLPPSTGKSFKILLNLYFEPGYNQNYREGGVGGFAVGLAPRMLRRSVMAALAWTVYEKITTSLKLK